MLDFAELELTRVNPFPWKDKLWGTHLEDLCAGAEIFNNAAFVRWRFVGMMERAVRTASLQRATILKWAGRDGLV
jgi:hypothetical protein